MKTSPPNLQYDALLCRYNEIATKGRNRTQFESLLIESLRRILREIGKLEIIRERGRIFARRVPPGTPFTPEDCERIRERVGRVMGLASISPGFLIAPELSAIEDTVYRTFPDVYDAVVRQLHGADAVDYCMRVRRSDKSFALTSKEMEVAFADRLLTEYPRLRVNLQHPTLCIDVEVRRERAFVSYGRIEGPGGLPSSSGGHVMALLSGGIDSPVACYEMMRRGCQVDYITFHSDPYTPPSLLAKVARIARMLNQYQIHGRLLAVNLLPAQKQVRDTCQQRYRTLLYRRLMVRVATAAARTLGDAALVTGDNIGQVASQTLENLGVMSAATRMLILRPLLTADKVKTVALAQDIGTLDMSKEDVPDSCTVFAPANPATGARLEQVDREEGRLDVPALLSACVDMAYEIDLETLEQKPLDGLHTWLLKCLEAGQICCRSECSGRVRNSLPVTGNRHAPA